MDESVLTRLRGNHTKDVFTNIFAFTIDELHSKGFLEDDRVNSQIYRAGMMGAQSLSKTLKSLGDEKTELFRKGGSKHRIASVAEKLREVESGLRDVADNSTRFGELTARLELIEKQREETTEQCEQLRSELRQQRQLESGWNDWNDLVSAKAALADIETVAAFPESGLSRLEAMEERIRGAEREYTEAKEQIKVAQARADVEVEHEVILEHADIIRRLERGRERLESALRDLPTRKTELADHDRQLKETLRELGPDWDEARLDAFDLSMAVREEITQFGECLGRADKELEDHKAEVATHKTSLQEAREAQIAAKKTLEESEKPSLDADQLSQRRTLIRTSHSQLKQMDTVRERKTVLQDQLDSLGSAATGTSWDKGQQIIVIVVGLVILGMLVGGIFLAAFSLVWSGLVALTVVILVGYLLASNSGVSSGAESPLAQPIRASLARAESELEELISSLEQARAGMSLETLDENSLIDAEQWLDKEQELIRAEAELTRKSHDAEELAESRKIRVERYKDALVSARVQVEDVRADWQEWLARRGLIRTLSPETVVEFRGRIELGLNQLRAVRDWRQRIVTIEKSISEYREEIAPLAQAFGIDFDGSQMSSFLAATDILVTLHADVEDKCRERRSAAEDLEGDRRRLAERKDELESVKKELGELLSSGGAADAEEFRRREAAYRQRKELENKRRDSLNRLQQVAGPGDPLKILQEKLGKTNIQAIKDNVRQLEEELSVVEAGLTEIAEQRGSLDTGLQMLTSEEKSSRLRAERGVLQEQLREFAREWAKRTLAERLLEEARSTFERERQPGVVRNAQSFFKEITGGRYVRVIAPLGEKTVRLVKPVASARNRQNLAAARENSCFSLYGLGWCVNLAREPSRCPSSSTRCS